MVLVMPSKRVQRQLWILFLLLLLVFCHVVVCQEQQPQQSQRSPIWHLRRTRRREHHHHHQKQPAPASVSEHLRPRRTEKELKAPTEKKSVPTLNVSQKDSPYALISQFFPDRERLHRRMSNAFERAYLNGQLDDAQVSSIGDLSPHEVWLSEGSLLILKGGATNDQAGPFVDPWAPLDDYEAPYREPKLPPADFVPQENGVGVPLPPEQQPSEPSEEDLPPLITIRRPIQFEPATEKPVEQDDDDDEANNVIPHDVEQRRPHTGLVFPDFFHEEKLINQMENFHSVRQASDAPATVTTARPDGFFVSTTTPQSYSYSFMSTTPAAPAISTTPRPHISSTTPRPHKLLQARKGASGIKAIRLKHRNKHVTSSSPKPRLHLTKSLARSTTTTTTTPRPSFNPYSSSPAVLTSPRPALAFHSLSSPQPHAGNPTLLTTARPATAFSTPLLPTPTPATTVAPPYPGTALPVHEAVPLEHSLKHNVGLDVPSGLPEVLFNEIDYEGFEEVSKRNPNRQRKTLFYPPQPPQPHFYAKANNNYLYSSPLLATNPKPSEVKSLPALARDFRHISQHQQHQQYSAPSEYSPEVVQVPYVPAVAGYEQAGYEEPSDRYVSFYRGSLQGQRWGYSYRI